MDKIFENWLEVEIDRAKRLAAESDCLDFVRLDRSRFLADFSCRGLVLGADGQVEEHDRFVVGLHFDDGYLRLVPSSMGVISWLSPRNAFHPNIKAEAGLCCIGGIAPGTSIVELIHRTYAVVTWQEVMPNEYDALNFAACSFARNHPERIPADDRPLRRRSASFRIGEPAVSS